MFSGGILIQRFINLIENELIRIVTIVGKYGNASAFEGFKNGGGAGSASALAVVALADDVKTVMDGVDDEFRQFRCVCQIGVVGQAEGGKGLDVNIRNAYIEQPFRFGQVVDGAIVAGSGAFGRVETDDGGVFRKSALDQGVDTFPGMDGQIHRGSPLFLGGVRRDEQ